MLGGAGLFGYVQGISTRPNSKLRLNPSQLLHGYFGWDGGEGREGLGCVFFVLIQAGDSTQILCWCKHTFLEWAFNQV